MTKQRFKKTDNNNKRYRDQEPKSRNFRSRLH